MERASLTSTESICVIGIQPQTHTRLLQPVVSMERKPLLQTEV